MNYNPSSFYQRVFDTPLGQALWDFLDQCSTIEGMQQVSDQERPAVEFLEQALPNRLRQEVEGDSDVNLIKQMIGHMVRQILEGNGYTYDSSGHKVQPEGGLFASGSRYVRN